MKKKIKIGIVGLVVIIILTGGFWFWQNYKKEEGIICGLTNPQLCKRDEDCICEDKGCFLGNKKYYEKCADKNTQCYDFCFGWGQKLVCQNQKCVETQALCEPDKIYVNLAQCRCPEGTEKFIETPEGGEEAVLVCRTILPCKGEAFYEKEVQSLGYQVLPNYVTISGCCISSSRNRARSESLDLYPGQEFYYTNTGKEQTVSVKLEKIKNNKAYLLFSYGAAPPACETVSGCDYTCEFIKE